ncbi:MAG: hypothetical protein JRJ87_25105 [Deltaproteobacteria bacterium]|nr:hypothetical protein [Deltaproteobacteria bacterium]
MRKLSILVVLLPFVSFGCKDNGCEPGQGDCGADEYCDPTTKQCMPNTCNHAEKCANRCCGDDGCGTGTDCEDNCESSATCNTITCTCQSCTPECGERVCGLDPVCGNSCGTCGANSTCSQLGLCECDFIECYGVCCASGYICNNVTSQCEDPVVSDGGDGSDGGPEDGDHDTPPDGGPDDGDQQNGDDLLPDGGPDAGDGGDQGVVIEGLGSACTCEGVECDQFGFPDPAGGTIVGCDDVPTNISGAALACWRTFESDMFPNTYYANGYCSLMASLCDGVPFVCPMFTIGDYDNMTTCPAGSVMITDSQVFEVMEAQVTVDTKICVASCDSSDDCRIEEVDPVLGNEPTQYDCLDYDGVKFCYDPRNLSEEYTATAF